MSSLGEYNNHSNAYVAQFELDHEAFDAFVGQIFTDPTSARIEGVGHRVRVQHLDYRCYEELDPGHEVEVATRTYSVEPFTVVMRGVASPTIEGRYSASSPVEEGELLSPSYVRAVVPAQIELPDLIVPDKLGALRGQELGGRRAVSLQSRSSLIDPAADERAFLDAEIGLAKIMSGWETVTIPKAKNQPERSFQVCADCK